MRSGGECIPLGELSDVITKGSTPKTLGFGYASAGIPFLRAENIRDLAVTWSEDALFIDEKTDEALSRSRIVPNDVLISIAGTIGRVGVVPEGVPRLNCNQAVAIVRPCARLSPRYLAHWLACGDAQRQIARAQVTATISNLSLGQIAKLSVPMRPIPEQRRIAHILDKADSIRRKRKEAIALTDEILRSTFLEMFGDPVINPMRWPVHQLAEAIERLDAGWSANGEARTHLPGEFGVLKVSAVTSGVFRPEEHKAVAAGAVDRELISPRKGDLLFSRANTRELVAATCLVAADFPTLFLPDKLWRITPNPGRATAEFLRFVLSHQRLRLELTKTATGTSGSMLNVSMEKLRALRVPLPPLESQARFSTFVWATIRTKEAQQRSSDQSEALFASLVNQSFQGELFGGSAC